MSSIKVTSFFGFIFRKDKLLSKSVSIEQLIKTLNIKTLDDNEYMVSFQPCFGSEAVNNLIKELEAIGLVYVDDYFLLEGDFPDWLLLRAEFNFQSFENK